MAYSLRLAARFAVYKSSSLGTMELQDMPFQAPGPGESLPTGFSIWEQPIASVGLHSRGSQDLGHYDACQGKEHFYIPF